jgi:para-nitrobenzyl esterase
MTVRRNFIAAALAVSVLALPFASFAQGAPAATIKQGALTGAVVEGVEEFWGIPYAAPPVGDLRFKLPQPVVAWGGERDATEHGPIAPQAPSRLRMAMGDFNKPQSEDCLTLTVWTPSADRARRPVLVWFHGGAFMSGAGSLPWYSGATMARRGNMVVVGVNYRLGALGFMYKRGVSESNLGLRDQFAAVEWISAHIDAFGGDPDNVTIAGQSAGGFSVLAMLAAPTMRQRFRRAIAQSAPFGRMMRSIDSATDTATKLESMLGIENPAQWLKVPATDIIAAQFKHTIASAQFANAMPPFPPVADGQLLGDDLIPAALAGAVQKDVIVGHTRDEMAAFYSVDDKVKNATPEQVASRFRDHFGTAADEALDEYRGRARTSAPESLLGELTGDAIFAGGTFMFAERIAAMGKPAHVFRFDWTAPSNPFLAGHCGEIPFVFDNFANWDAPMLKGGDATSMQALGDVMQDAWIAFAHTGNPQHAALTSWPQWTPERDAVMVFDDASRVEDDPAGRKRYRYWP